MSEPRLRVSYILTLPIGDDPEARARAIALEQTVELPAGAFPDAVGESVVGRVEAVEVSSRQHAQRVRAAISYGPEVIGSDLLQLVNVVFGNVSLQSGIRVAAIDWMPQTPPWLDGPRFGIEGLRELCREPERPLVATALKPVGLAPAELARLCGEFARAGIDIIKDDHGLVQQATAPLADRLALCQEAVAEANAATGGASLYFPNLTVEVPSLEERLAWALDAGCRGCMVSPLLSGLDTVRRIAQTDPGLAILAHPALSGAYFGTEHGVAPEVLLGQLFRWAGADGVIYPNVGGRFAFRQADCDAINFQLRSEVAGLRSAFPVPAGGLDVQSLGEWVDRYGSDTIFLIGGDLYRRADLGTAARQLMDSVRRHWVARRH